MKKGIGLGLIFLPILFQLNPQIQLISLFIGAIFLWIFDGIEFGSLACLTGLFLLPGVTPTIIFQNSIGNATIPFLLFSFLLTYGLDQVGVLRKIAILFISNNIARKNQVNFLRLYLLSILIIGSFIAPTTVFILYFGIVKEIFILLQLHQDDEFAKRLMLGTGFFASISCALTPIAHTFPLMALGYYETLTGKTINYIQYLKFSLPVGLIIAIIAIFILEHGLNKIKPVNVTFEYKPWNKQQIIALSIFILVVLCWILPGIMPTIFKPINTLGTAFPAIVGCGLMMMFGILNIKDGFKNGISWSALLLCATTLALGKVLTLDQFGITELITTLFSNYFNILLIIIFTVILTNLISNIVTTTLAFNIFIPSMIINPIIGTILIGFGASLAYALPSSIAHIALTASSGYATTKDTLKYGSILTIISIIVMYVGAKLWI